MDALVGGLVAGAGQLAGGIMGGIAAGQANDIALQNLQHQKDLYQYQTGGMQYEGGLQGELFRREDSSVQRRVKDLEAAGLSPILAAGQGARAGAPIPATAPQRGTQGQQMLQGVGQQVRDIGLTAAQTALTLAQKEKTSTEATVARATAEARIAERIQEAAFSVKSLELELRNHLPATRRKISEADMAQAHATIARIDSRWYQDLKALVVEKGFENPMVVEYLTARLIEQIRRLDKKFYTTNLVIRGVGTAAGAVARFTPSRSITKRVFGR